MDIHRCRFVPYPPSTINALAFSHSHISKDQKTAPPRLAVGRANGDIEIWNPLKGLWLQETIIRGGKDRSIDGLVWTQDPNEDVEGRTIIGKSRLFSIGYTTTVTEWNLETGRPLRNASGNHGEIWCIAAQPALLPAEEEDIGSSAQWTGQSLIAGCTDGALVLYSTKDDDLQLQKVLIRPSSKKAKIISVAFQDRNIVVAGCTDSTIRIFDIRTGALLRNMTTGSGPKGGPKEIIIWCVKVLKSGNIVSGDSTGEVKIWDGKTFTMSQRIKSHKQDVLSLATSHDGSAIFSGGMDRRTITYKPVGKGKQRWAEVAHRRFHNHDVKTMASFEGLGMSVFVSGGPDASPIVVPLGKFGFEHQRALPFLAQEPIIRSAPSKRLMASWWDREVHIWRMNKQSKAVTTEESEDEAEVKGRKLVAKMLIKGEANITSTALSADGNLVTVATTTDLKMFLLRSKKPEDGEGLRVSKVVVPASIASGARLVQFSPDGKWLCIIRPDSHILLVRITSEATSVTVHSQASKPSRLDRRIEKNILLGGLGTYDRTISQVTFSSDSRILAISDIAGYIDTFVLSGNEDLTLPIPEDEADAASSDSSDPESDSDEEEESKTRLIFGQHWTRNPAASLLPKLPAAPVVLSFRPGTNDAQKPLSNGVSPHPTRNNPHPVPHDLPEGEDRLLVVTATSDVFEFEVLKGGLSAWSRRNPTSSFPPKFKKSLDQVRGCIWDVKDSRERIWLYSINSLWMFDLSQDFPPDPAGAGSRKRKRAAKEHPSGAGGHVEDHQLNTGISRKMQKRDPDEVEIEEVEMLVKDDDAMDVDEDVDDVSTLQRLIYGDTETEDAVKGTKSRSWHWKTFKYRPILGIVEIGEGDEFGPEVALVERPIWEADLPPRYYGEQEWKDKEMAAM
ncbi:WD40 repeat-like protein [Mollisia scopiformis]|uniref:WD40 repeat-like protein n=1 Tax=Mollisia scopiformis TaxID=149040 RepID=A0A194XUP5_MOLSC|nr:WD40 repeat-like protein [Mollisia scopiformis]KUJ23759.1 WD40 repeat-like protein [Mollisia scopiformis]